MVPTNRSFILLALASGSSVFAQNAPRYVESKSFGQISSVRAWNVLTKTMESHRKVRCRAMITRRDAMEPNTTLDIWMVQSDEGHQKQVVLAPLSDQGHVMIDNGNQWINYNPDENRVIIETSPHWDSSNDIKFRIHLAQQNYELQAESLDQEIAGRKSFCFLATPRHPEMPSRRYCIDRKNGFLLRMEIVAKEGIKVMLDTKHVEFPNSIPSEEFELEAKDAKIVTYPAPTHLAIDKGTKSIVGFNPAVPTNLPFGFVIEDPQVVDGKEGKFVAVRITDGLVNATIYEWRKAKHSSPQEDQQNERTAKNLKLRLVGEVPEVVMAKLLDSFVREAFKQLEPCLARLSRPETLRSNKTLNSIEDPNQEDFGPDRDSLFSEDLDIVFIERGA